MNWIPYFHPPITDGRQELGDVSSYDERRHPEFLANPHAGLSRSQCLMRTQCVVDLSIVAPHHDDSRIVRRVCLHVCGAICLFAAAQASAFA